MGAEGRRGGGLGCRAAGGEEGGEPILERVDAGARGASGGGAA